MSVKIMKNSVSLKDETTQTFLPIGMFAAGGDKSLKEFKEFADTTVNEANTQVQRAHDNVGQLTESITSALETGTDTTLSLPGVAADAKATGDKMKEIKEDLSNLSSEIAELKSDYTFELTWINNEYIETDGTITTFNGWRRTLYTKIPNTKKISFECKTSVLKYNAFYDENKNFISSFVVLNGAVVDVPSNAHYFALSGGIEQTSSYIVKCLVEGIEGIEKGLGLADKPKKLKICSFNVGMWTDGVSKGVPTEEVTNKSIVLRRFLGKESIDFLLCQEARKYFDANGTVIAYEENIKHHLPYHFQSEDSQYFYGTREMLVTGKETINNVAIHTYECGSERQYITFESIVNGLNVNFVLCHLSTEGNSNGIRQLEMKELADVLKQYEYGVLCGDFNVFSIDEFVTHFSDFNMANHGYYGDFNTWPVEGWETWNHCLDNIITTKNIKITNVYMGEIAMSDHKPLIAELEI